MNNQIVRKEGAARTPAVIVSELERYGRLEGMSTKRNYFYKFFSFMQDYYEVTYLNDNGSVGEVVSIRRITKDEFNYLVPHAADISGLNFKIGGF